MASFYSVMKDFAAPAATFVAALAAVSVTAYFAWHQKRIAQGQATIAKEKLRYDLFERRLAIFGGVFDYYQAIVFWEGSVEQQRVKERFFRGYQESKFLFSKESGIEGILKELNDQGNRVIAFKEHADQLKADRDAYHRFFQEVQDIQTSGFSNGLSALTQAISAYLNFHEI